MTTPPRLPSRRSTRLAGYDYASNGAYVITMCSHQRRHLFGTIRDGCMHSSPLGDVVVAEWERTALMRQSVILDAFVLIPNHLHGIVILNTEHDGRVSQTGQFVAPSESVSAIVRGLKSAVTGTVKRRYPDTAFPIWQRGFHDRIIRDDRELEGFREYIVNNPRQWELDRFFGDR